jgi:hypothetical protein
MTTETEQVLEEALDLPSDERRELIAYLVASLDTPERPPRRAETRRPLPDDEPRGEDLVDRLARHAR